MKKKEDLPRKKDKNELFAERITELRKEEGKKQKEVAVDLGLTVGTLSAYETGREPRYEYLNKFANYYGVTVDYLTGNSNHKTIKEEVLYGELGLNAGEAKRIMATIELPEPIKEMHFKLLSSEKYITLLERIVFWEGKANDWDALKQNEPEIAEKYTQRFGPARDGFITSDLIKTACDTVNGLSTAFNLERAFYQMGYDGVKTYEGRYGKKESE